MSHLNILNQDLMILQRLSWNWDVPYCDHENINFSQLIIFNITLRKYKIKLYNYYFVCSSGLAVPYRPLLTSHHWLNHCSQMNFFMSLYTKLSVLWNYVALLSMRGVQNILICVLKMRVLRLWNNLRISNDLSVVVKLERW